MISSGRHANHADARLLQDMINDAGLETRNSKSQIRNKSENSKMINSNLF